MGAQTQGAGPRQEEAAPGTAAAEKQQTTSGLSGVLNPVNRNLEDEQRRDQRLAGSGRIVEVNKKDFELFVATREPGGLGPFRTFFNGRSVFCLPLIAPWGLAYRCWYLMVLFLDLTYTAFVFPYNEAWRINEQVMYKVEVALGFIFVLDVLINMHTPYVLRFKNEKLLVNNGLQLMWLYITEDTFIVDSVTAIVFFTMTVVILNPSIDTSGAGWQIARAIRLFRLYRIYLIMKDLVLGTWVHSFVQARGNNTLLSIRAAYLLGMAYSTIVLINCLACLWWAVGSPRVGDPRATSSYWPSSAGGMGDILGLPYWRQYVASIYYVATTITTTGYGDIVPRSTVEQIFAMLIMACGALFFAFLIGSVVGQIMQSGAAARRSAKFKEKIQVVELFMDINCVSKSMQNRIFKFYSDVWTRQQEEEELWSSIEDLGPTVKAQLLTEMVGPYLQALQPFASLSHLSMLALSGLLEPMPLAPEMDICRHGDPADCLWILQEGSVAQLKGEKQVSGEVWAPGLLGTAALHPVLGPAMRRTYHNAMRETLMKAKAEDAAASVLEGLAGQEQGHGQGAGLGPEPSGLRPHSSGALREMERQSDEALAEEQRRAAEEEQTNEEAVQPYTLRTLRSCTLFRLSVPKLMSLLANLDPWEAYEIEQGLIAAMKAADGGQMLGHASRNAVRGSFPSKANKSRLWGRSSKSHAAVSSGTRAGSRETRASSMPWATSSAGLEGHRSGSAAPHVTASGRGTEHQVVTIDEAGPTG